MEQGYLSTLLSDPRRYESSVKTALESVEDLFPENLRPALGLTPGDGAGRVDYEPNESEERDVDEKRILGFMNNEEDDYPYDSDEEVMREIEFSQRRPVDKVEEKNLDSKDLTQLEHDIDDESRPAGQQYGAQFLESGEPSILDGSAGPSSIAGVEAADMVENTLKYQSGGAGSHGSQEEDNMNQTDKPAMISKRQEHPDHSENALNKRQKFAHEISIGNHSTKPFAESRGILHTTIMKPATTTTSRFSRNSRSINKKSSQDSMKSNDKSQSQPLLFPVVKDPQDPSTIQRLSQKSASQDSPSNMSKRISFKSFLSLSQDPNHRQTTTTDSETQSSLISFSTPVAGVMKKMQHAIRK